MVDIAQEAVLSNNFELASQIYERIIKEKGPACHLLVELGNSLAQSGRISEAFTAFLKAYRLGYVSPDDLKHLVKALIRLTRDRMEASTEEGQSNLLLDTRELLDNEPFFCGICLGAIVEPTTIYCGHTYCSKCITKKGIHTCISCGDNPQIALTYRPNVLLGEIVTKLFPKFEDIIKLKKDANRHFAERQYKDAIECYTEILDICEYKFKGLFDNVEVLAISLSRRPYVISLTLYAYHDYLFGRLNGG